MTSVQTPGAAAIGNHARSVAIRALDATLRALRGRDVTELDVKNEWLARMTENSSIVADGWYDPPPSGITVLAADSSDPHRISFETLRKQQWWPSSRQVVWEDALLYFYCSPVDRTSGVIGDLAVTLYFGRDPALRQHLTRAREALRAVVSLLGIIDRSRDLFRAAEREFAERGFRNAVVSYTDVTPLDLGHSVTSAPPYQFEPGTDEWKNHLRTTRLFINDVSDWPLTSVDQFTVEPQLVSRSDDRLPQVTHHVLCAKRAGVHASSDIWQLIEEFETATG